MRYKAYRIDSNAVSKEDDPFTGAGGLKKFIYGGIKNLNKKKVSLNSKRLFYLYGTCTQILKKAAISQLEKLFFIEPRTAQSNFVNDNT